MVKAIKFLLIPAVIICAVLSLESAQFDMKILVNSMIGKNYIFLYETVVKSDKNFWFFDKYTPAEKLILYGDLSKFGKGKQQKKIFDKFPDDKIFLANYILGLFSSDRRKEDKKQHLLQEIAFAKQKEPENALYNYLAASIYFSKGCRWGYIHKNKRKKKKDKYKFKIINPEYMKLGVAEFLKGTKKKYCKSYCWDMLGKRLDIMGKPKTLKENLDQLMLAASVLLPQLNAYRRNAVCAWRYAKSLQENGKNQEALAIIKPWKIYVRQTNTDCVSLIDVLVSMAIIEQAKKKIPAIYRKAGKDSLAESSEKLLNKLAKVRAQWKAGIAKSKQINKEVLAKSGVITKELLPALGNISIQQKDLIVTNKIEYNTLEKAKASLLTIIMLAGLILASLSAVFWRIRAKQKAILLSPSLKTVGKIFLIGFVAPVCLYLLIIIAGGHEYNISRNMFGVICQNLIVISIIPLIMFLSIKRYVKRRCCELDVATPQAKLSKTLCAIAIIFYSLLTGFSIFQVHKVKTNYSILSVLVLTIIGVFIILLVIALVKFVFSSFASKKYALYYGTLAKTTVPILALAIIFINIIIVPFLNFRECNLLEQEKIIFGDFKHMTPIEGKITSKLKDKLMNILDQKDIN